MTAEERSAVESALADVKSCLEANEGDKLDAEELKTKTEALRQAAYKLAEEMYKQAAQANAAESGAEADGKSEPAGAANGSGNGARRANGAAAARASGAGAEKVEDVDYEVVDDDDKK